MKRGFSAVTGLGLVLTMVVGMGVTGCVTKTEFNEYKAAIKADGEEIERWATQAQAWMVAMTTFVRSQHPTGDPPDPPDPGPCLSGCEWGDD